MTPLVIMLLLPIPMSLHLALSSTLNFLFKLSSFIIDMAAPVSINNCRVLLGRVEYPDGISITKFDGRSMPKIESSFGRTALFWDCLFLISYLFCRSGGVPH